MKKTINITILALIAAIFSFSSFTQAELKKAAIVWKGFKVIGGGHEGTLTFSKSDLQFKKGKLVGGEFVVDMTSLKNTDMQGDYAQKLEAHLKNDDFFGVDKFPTSQFKITKVKSLGNDEYQVTGDFTIKGITKSETFKAKVITEGKKAIATATITIDRTKYNVQYGSTSFFDSLGDKAISNDFELNINIETAIN
jgi:polyisoprenoid-binding protein YceI